MDECGDICKVGSLNGYLFVRTMEDSVAVQWEVVDWSDCIVFDELQNERSKEFCVNEF
jgi:hypothetical protein